MTVSVRSLVIRVCLIAAACAVLGFGGILDPAHAVLVGCLLTSAFLLSVHAWNDAWLGWPRRPTGSRAGGRDQVSNLSWQAFDRDNLVRSQVVHRVGALAAARLARLGVDVGDPAQQGEVERLLGPRVAAGLGSAKRPTARTLQSWLDAIDRLPDERIIR